MKKSSFALGLLAAMALAGCNRETNIDRSQASAPATAPTPTQTTTTTAQTTQTTVTPAQVKEVVLGRDLGPDQLIVEKTTTFAPSDTVYMTVMTESAPEPATVVARWTFEDGSVVEETRQVVQPADTGSVAAFHVTKPEGWPAGNYKVEIQVDGQTVETREFSVS